MKNVKIIVTLNYSYKILQIHCLLFCCLPPNILKQYLISFYRIFTSIKINIDFSRVKILKIKIFMNNFIYHKLLHGMVKTSREPCCCIVRHIVDLLMSIVTYYLITCYMVTLLAYLGACKAAKGENVTSNKFYWC